MVEWTGLWNLMLNILKYFPGSSPIAPRRGMDSKDLQFQHQRVFLSPGAQGTQGRLDSKETESLRGLVTVILEVPGRKQRDGEGPRAYGGRLD